MLRRLNFPASSTRYDTILLRGGLDLVTPLIQLKPGYVRDALNWEQSITGGYSRLNGYERHDGRPAPSAAIYLTLTITLTGAIAVGNTITGLTSGATGVVISMTLVSGSQYVLAFTKGTGAFVDAEAVQVAAVTQATIDDVGGAGTGLDFDVTQANLAADVYRADITAVPGDGPVRGVARLNNVTYAWRNNVGNTALAIYKSTVGGWTLVPLMEELAFTAGGTEYTAGETVSQGGVSATVKAVCLESGVWGGTAVGRLIISGRSGGNFAAGAIAGGGSATAGGVQTAITLSPGGRVVTDKGNFGLGQRIFGADGVNRMFMFDGETLAPITIAGVSTPPSQVLVHADHLWAAYGDNVQNSGIANPFNWTALGGSVAYRVNGTVTGMFRQPGSQAGGAMSIATTSTTENIYGTSSADFQKVSFEETAGARPYGSQRIGGQALCFGDTGVYSMTAAQEFGNFTPSSMTLAIRPFTQARKSLCSASLVNREKSQYRVFFSDGYGLYLTMVNGRMAGAMPVQFPNEVVCACQGDTGDGVETAFFGSDNGFVYQLDVGTSFDGEPIDSYITLTFANQGNSRVLKRYAGATLEVQGETYATFDATYDLNYSDIERPTGGIKTGVLALTPAQWDTPSMVWDSFVWDGRSLAPSNIEITGTGENIALRIAQNDDRFGPITINSIILHYKVRKALKKAA